MRRYKFPVEETINGVTLTFVGPEMDPLASPNPHPKDKQGDFTEYFLWRDGDNLSAVHRVWFPNPSGNKIELLTRRTETDTWWYTIRTNKQTFERSKPRNQ